MAIISMKNVSLRKQGKNLLTGINWTVEKGQTWAILGLNGAGKTTLLKLIMAEHYPTDGQTEILDVPFGQGDISEIRKRIGIVSGFISDRLSLQMVAEQAVLTGKYKSSILYKEYGKKELGEARDMLTRLDGEKLIGRRLHTLSQGERQLIMIARCLMEEPDIIILDEATVGLDLFAREKLLKQIDRITDLPQAPTVLYVTHHAEEITQKMDHVLLLKQGRIIAQGKKEDIITLPTLTEFFDNQVSIIPIDDHRFFIKPEL
ncbi:ABC transporter ATP-binding protein [Streptococcus tangpeifui]|uniref:ABC transporter ATP-binding protein n=2 Tax=Streptococcus tangpeifui TaxID=2709400 RepID=UPI0013EC4768|nr:ABC transporter ATP-binding protein [Streptococcus sp. ZJ1593]